MPEWSEMGLTGWTSAGSVETEAFCCLRSRTFGVADLWDSACRVRLLVTLVPISLVEHLPFVRKIFSNNLISLGEDCPGTEHDRECKRIFVYSKAKDAS